jgi:hypothetical protein
MMTMIHDIKIVPITHAISSQITHPVWPTVILPHGIQQQGAISHLATCSIGRLDHGHNTATDTYIDDFNHSFEQSIYNSDAACNYVSNIHPAYLNVAEEPQLRRP